MTTMIQPLGAPYPRARLWTALQLAGVAATAALLAGLVVWPTGTLTILWNVVVPILPATFLVAPALWRNACPLATINMASNGIVSRRRPSPAAARYARIIGIVLLIVLVPARRFLFNTNGAALAVVIVAVAMVALAAGAVFDMKTGFCNAICPVLPVERLYGQNPLVPVENPRCASCATCAPNACVDISPTKSIAQTIGPRRKTTQWLATPYGAFAAAFPGFIIAYYTLADGPVSQAGYVYATVAAWMAGSWILSAIVVTTFRIDARLAIAGLAATSIGLYYWFAAPVVARTLGAPNVGTRAIRIAAAALIATWITESARHSQRTRTSRVTS